MLKVTIKGDESWDKEKRIFIYSPDIVLELEHSLVSVSKWEQKTKKPFLQGEKTEEESRFYIECMSLTPEFPPEAQRKLSQSNMNEIADYIGDPMTATWFTETPSGTTSQIITSDLIYSWMIAYQIEFEAQHWHLNKLITLIKVIDHQRANANKKRSSAEVARQQSRIAAERRKLYEGGD